jgi:hypothetical protein
VRSSRQWTREQIVSGSPLGLVLGLVIGGLCCAGGGYGVVVTLAGDGSMLVLALGLFFLILGANSVYSAIVHWRRRRAGETAPDDDEMAGEQLF